MNAASFVLAKLKGLSPRERVILAVGAAALLVFVFLRWVVFAQIDQYRKARAAIPARRATISRYMAFAQGRGWVEEALGDAADRLADAEEGLLPGDNPSAAAATLQGIIKPWIGRADTRLISTRTLAPVTKGPYSEVAVQVDLQTTTEGLAELLAQIQRHRLLLRVRKLSVSSGAYAAALANRREVLTATIVVAGVTDAAADETAGGGER